MTILPGSLDNLYYNGIIDYIPYEAYSMPMLGNNCRYQAAYDPKYLDHAMNGYAYQYNGSDCFVPSNPIYFNDYKQTPWQEFKGYLNDEKNKIKSIPNVVKGLFAGGVIATTLALLIKKIKH